MHQKKNGMLPSGNLLHRHQKTSSLKNKKDEGLREDGEKPDYLLMSDLANEFSTFSHRKFKLYMTTSTIHKEMAVPKLFGKMNQSSIPSFLNSNHLLRMKLRKLY